MKAEMLEELIKGNREIEFVFRGHQYSITYYNDKRKNYISVCEFYKKPIDVATPSDVLKLKIGRWTLQEIFANLPDSAIDIY